MKLSALLYLTGLSISVKEVSGKVFLQCQESKDDQKPNYLWKKGKEELGNMRQLDLGAIYDDPRGTYTCQRDENVNSTLHVHYRSECLKLSF